MTNNEKKAFNILKKIGGDFIDFHARPNDQKTFPIGTGVYLRFTVVSLHRMHTRFTVQVIDDRKLESFQWQVQVYMMGFARALTFEQHGLVVRCADRDDGSRDYETFASINDFFIQFLDGCAGDVVALERVA
jgi:hypothetical protein